MRSLHLLADVDYLALMQHIQAASWTHRRKGNSQQGARCQARPAYTPHPTSRHRGDGEDEVVHDEVAVPLYRKVSKDSKMNRCSGLTRSGGASLKPSTVTTQRSVSAQSRR